MLPPGRDSDQRRLPDIQRPGGFLSMGGRGRGLRSACLGSFRVEGLCGGSRPRPASPGHVTDTDRCGRRRTVGNDRQAALVIGARANMRRSQGINRS